MSVPFQFNTTAVEKAMAAYSRQAKLFDSTAVEKAMAAYSERARLFDSTAVEKAMAAYSERARLFDSTVVEKAMAAYSERARLFDSTVVEKAMAAYSQQAKLFDFTAAEKALAAFAERLAKDPDLATAAVGLASAGRLLPSEVLDDPAFESFDGDEAGFLVALPTLYRFAPPPLQRKIRHALVTLCAAVALYIVALADDSTSDASKYFVGALLALWKLYNDTLDIIDDAEAGEAEPPDR